MLLETQTNKIMLSIKEAIKETKCRICEKDLLPIGSKHKEDWYEELYEIMHPVHIILDYGREHAHKNCLNQILKKG